MERALSDKDFTRVAELTMKDSNCLHACCLDTYPPLFYLNDKSRQIIQLVNQFNEMDSAASPKVAYSFDAGPNAFLFVLDEHLLDFLYTIYKLYFIYLTEDEFAGGKLVKVETASCDIRSLDVARKRHLDEKCTFFKGVTQRVMSSSDCCIKYLIHSKVGRNPSVTVNDAKSSLLTPSGHLRS